MNSTTSTTTREHQDNHNSEGPPPIEIIGELAVALEGARFAIEDLLSRSCDGREVVEQRYDGPDGLSWGELRRELRAWDYFFNVARGVLESHFTHDVAEAIRAAFDFDEAEDEAQAAALAVVLSSVAEDAPTVREAAAPPATKRPYWLS